MNTSPKYVAAIGASAGGLQPLQQLVENLPDDIGDIAVIIAQHLSPEYKSMLTDIISRNTNIKVTSIIDGEQLQANHIYITPPNCDALFRNNQLEIVETGSTGPRPSIDRLFTSLAKNFKNNAAAIILSGTGQDGSKGIVQVKNNGGLTIVQSLESAKYTGMPQAAINTGKIDTILTPERIGETLVDLILYDRPVPGNNELKDQETEDINDTTRLLNLVENRLGTNFNNYKSATIIRRIQKRMKDKNFPNLKQYLLYVEDNEEELDEFFEYLLIGVTSFFRDSEAFDALKDHLRPMVAAKEGKSVIRVWIPGCATGEESVSIAITLFELIKEINRTDIKVQIFATDINVKALQKARRGRYDNDKVESLPQELIDRYFILEDGKYETNIDVKNAILYTAHDISSSPPFLRLDLVTCRNLFIYFNQQLQNELFPVFHYSLNENGLLFLGKSETIGDFKNLFDTVESKYRLFRKKDVGHHKAVRMPGKKPVSSKTQGTKTGAVHEIPLHEMVKETLYNNYDKPYVIIDDGADIIEISGNINPFIELRSGAINVNLLRLIKEEYKLEIRALLAEAAKDKKPTNGRLRRMQDADMQQFLRLMVVPLQKGKPNVSYYLVVFDGVEIDLPYISSDETFQEFTGQQRISELEYELERNKLHMNTLVEELETGNEELQALNEEMQSSNEELQASNEELETSNEELQATNEELENAYMDLRTLTGRLTRQKDLWEQLCNTSPDLIAVLRGDDFIFEYVNKPFTDLYPKKKLLGNSILAVLPEVVEQGFYEKMQEVRNSRKALSQSEVSFETDYSSNGKKEIKYFTFTYAPLVSDETNKADVIIYATDVTTLVASRIEIEADARFFGTLAEAMPQKVWVAAESGLISYVNETFKTVLGLKNFSANKMNIEQFIFKDDLEAFRNSWQDALKVRKPFKMKFRLVEMNNHSVWHSCDFRPLIAEDGNSTSWVCAAIDINVEKSIEEKKDEFMSIASHELKTPLTTLTGYIQLLEGVIESEDCDTAKLYTQKASKSLHKISSLVSDLLDVTRLETGEMKFIKANVDFDNMVVDVLDEFRHLCKNKITLVGNTTKAIVYADSIRLGQVMINLLSNAVKYSPVDSDITVKVSADASKVTYEVHDLGNGVPTEFIDKIFNRFFRVTEKNSFKSGLGIGLYISRQIVQRHQGDIIVTNNENGGATFTIALPKIV